MLLAVGLAAATSAGTCRPGVRQISNGHFASGSHSGFRSRLTFIFPFPLLLLATQLIVSPLVIALASEAKSVSTTTLSGYTTTSDQQQKVCFPASCLF